MKLIAVLSIHRVLNQYPYIRSKSEHAKLTEFPNIYGAFLK